MGVGGDPAGTLLCQEQEVGCVGAVPENRGCVFIFCGSLAVEGWTWVCVCSSENQPCLVRVPRSEDRGAAEPRGWSVGMDTCRAARAASEGSPPPPQEGGERWAGGRRRSSWLLPAPRRCLTWHKLLTLTALNFHIC